MTQLNRNEINSQFQWDLSKIYTDENAWVKDFKKIQKMLPKLVNYQGKIMKNAKNLYNFLSSKNDFDRLTDKVGMYTYLHSDEDTGDTHYQELNGLVENFLVKSSTNLSFVQAEILKENYSLIEEFYNKLPKLREYEINLKRIFRMKNHILSDKEQFIYNSFTNVLNNPDKTYGLLTDADMTFGTIKDEDDKLIELTDSNYSIYLKSSNREVRKSAFKLMYETYSHYKNTIASTLSGNVEVNSVTAKVKNFSSALECSLYKNNIDKKVYDNLIKTVTSNLSPIYEYYKLKKEVLGLEQLHLYDVYTPLIENVSNKYSYEDAKKLVIEALDILGKDYVTDLKKAFNERWIDVFSNPGKRSGAYSYGSYDTYPYILLNYEGTFNDVSTLAHELGHSMHSYYSHQNNPYQYGHYKIFVAEVASTVNELLLRKYLLNKTTNKREKLSNLNSLLELFRTTIYRQTMFAEFEEKIYNLFEKGNVLTHELLSNTYYELNKKYFGEDVVVDQDIKYEWSRIPHFYMNFYVYQYATGLSAACYIVNKIINNEENAVNNYLDFLKTGGSLDSLEELKITGVDMKDSSVIISAIQMFEDTLNEFKELYQEVGEKNE